MTLVLLCDCRRTSGGHGLLEALPRIYQVTPDIPDRRRATQQKEVRPLRPTASMRVSSPPGRDHLHLVGRHRQPRIQTASLDAIARLRVVRRTAAAANPYSSHGAVPTRAVLTSPINLRRARTVSRP